MRTIYIANQSSLVSAGVLAQAIAALQVQVWRDFTPAWGIYAQLLPAAAPPPGVEVINLLDNSDQADALGYHTVNAADKPVGYVFVKTTMQAGDAWTATLSHELLEQLADPWVCATAVAPWLGKQAAIAMEVGDPVENDEYAIGAVKLSNFILPPWFVAQPPAGARVDFLGTLKGKSLSMSKGGYVAYTADLSNWQQSFAEHCPPHQRALERYSRRHRRIVGRAHRKAA